MSILVALHPPAVAEDDLRHAEQLGRIQGILAASFDKPSSALESWLVSDCAIGTWTAYRRAYVKAYVEAATC